jgi:hypothetical protein
MIEYKTFDLVLPTVNEPKISPQMSLEALNKLGDDGWDVAGILYSNGNRNTLLLKKGMLQLIEVVNETN